MQRESAWPMVSVAEALQVVSHISRTPLSIEMIAPHRTSGRVLAETVVAPADMPAEPRATVDGYAIRTSDGDVPRQVIAELTAGGGERLTLAPGS